MSWANLKELILQERRLLECTEAPEFPQESAFETQHSALLSCYLQTKAEVEAAIRAFAQTLEWPELKPLEKFFLVGRLDFAWETASILNTSAKGEALIAYPCPEKCTTGELLEWLLIDIWPYGCGRFLQSQKWLAEQGLSGRKLPIRVAREPASVKCVA